MDSTLDDRRQRLNRLRNRFIAVNLRSRSLRLIRTTRSGALDLQRLACDAPLQLQQLTRSLGRGEAELELAATASEVLASDIAYLHRRVHESWLETGAQDLAVGWPILEGRSAQGVWLRAPLMLYAAELVPGRRWTLRLLGPPEVNESLAQTLARLCGVRLTLDELLQDDDDRIFALDSPTWRGIGACLTRLGLPLTAVGDLPPLTPLEDRTAEQRESAPINQFALRHHLVLGRFPCAASALVTDYDALLADEPTDERLALAADLLQVDETQPASEPLSPARPGQEATPDGLDGLRQWLVLDSDSSQDAVLRWVEQPDPASRGLVVQGPPGTGKSQLIANLVAAGLARGLSILLVCQKRAALDVVADRLGSLGLREPIALVHDIHRDRNDVCAGIVRSLQRGHEEAQSTTAHEEERAFARTLARLQGGIEASQRSFDLLTRHIEGRPPLAELDERALDDPGHPLPDLSPIAGAVTEAEVGQALPRLTSHASQTQAMAHPHPLAARDDWATATDALIARSFAAVDQALGTITELQQVDGGHLTPGHSLEHARLWAAAAPLLHHIEACGAGEPRSSAERSTQDVTARDLSVVRRFELFWVWTGGRTAHGAWARVVEQLEHARETLRPTPEELVLEREAALTRWIDELQRLKQLAHRWYRLFLPRFWRLRQLPRQILERCASWSEQLATPALLDLSDLCQRALQWQALIAGLPTDNPFFDYGLMGRMEDIDNALGDLRQQHDRVEAVHQLHQALSQRGAAYAALPSIGPDAPDPWDQSFFQAALADARRARLLAELDAQLDQAQGTIDAGFLRLMRRARARASQGADVHGLREILDARGDVERARELDRLLAQEPPWVRLFLRGWRPRADHDPPDPVTDATLALQRAWRELALDGQRRAAVEAPLVDDGALERLGQDLDQCRDRARGTIVAMYHGRLRTALQDTRGRSLRRLEAEAQKQRRRLTLRQLIARYWDDALSLVRPVWFGSPETVAALFPLKARLFDLIIFDEASQCPVESAVPVLMRGRRAVIAGDEKQMPPSHFFHATDDDPLAEEEEEVLASQSLLSLARIAFGYTVLRWHYRSHHESLIAFSNSAYYGGALLTAPGTSQAPGPFSGVHWQPVRGAWIDGTNHTEAVAVVELMGQVLSLGSLTVGVVTFNLPQADLIRELMQNSARLAPLLQADRARPPVEQVFVRNLENVQGDERDVIIFSVGYGPTRPGGPVHARFGPLGQIGGENRLNVAITRARHGVWVLCSFDPDRLDVATSRNPGPRLFKLYLQYIRTSAELATDPSVTHDILRQAASLAGEPGAVAGVSHVQRRVGARVARELAAALSQAGHPPLERHGLGPLRIDLAFPQQQLAIDCSEFLALQDPLTRDVYTPRFWRRMGWRLQRVTPGMWNEQRLAVLSNITDHLSR